MQKFGTLHTIGLSILVAVMVLSDPMRRGVGDSDDNCYFRSVSPPPASEVQRVIESCCNSFGAIASSASHQRAKIGYDGKLSASLVNPLKPLVFISSK
jgi:hypothetical protein